MSQFIKRSSLNLSALLVILFASLCACSEGSSETEPIGIAASSTETERTAEITELSWLDCLPEADYNGYQFKILIYNNAAEEHRADEINGEPLNDAIYKRNAYVENRYNIDIAVTDMMHEDYIKFVSKTAQAGEDAYDLYQIFLAHAASKFVPAGYFVDWNEIPYVNENLNQLWWSQYGVEQLKIQRKNYLINGDIGHLTLGNTTGLLFNKKLFDQMDFAYPYQSVLNGTWTLDALMELCLGQNQDLNGDSMMSFDDDLYSFLSTKWVAPIGGMIACDLNTLVYAEDGYPQLHLLTERTLTAYEKWLTILEDSGAPLVDYKADVMQTEPYKLFMENRALIIAAGIDIISDLRHMNSDFGIIPYPKFDEEQKNYMSSVDAGTTSAAVMITAEDVTRTGLITEALCEKGSEIVIPAYYEVLLQGKSSRDNESQDMLDIIRETACFDPLYVYNFNNMGFFFIDCMVSARKELSGLYQSREKATVKAIDDFWNHLQ